MSESKIEEVWRWVIDEQVRIIGIYGIGGVGKTTLLKQIYKRLTISPHNFDTVIWVTVSQNLSVEKVQDDIWKRIGVFDVEWVDKSFHEKAQAIRRVLSKKKFVLLLDDLGRSFDLRKLGVPCPGPKQLDEDINTLSSQDSSEQLELIELGLTDSEENDCKVVLTTRSQDVCSEMGTEEATIEMETLEWKDAWKLFKEKVGEDKLVDPKIQELAQLIVPTCRGLPMLLCTVGRAMASRRTYDEWLGATQRLRGVGKSDSEMDSAESSQPRGRGKNKKVWSLEEDRALIESLQEVATDPRFKQDNTWKNGYLIRVEELINQKLPMHFIRADPHIDSRWKTMKGKYNAISDMLNKSGFGWDDTRKMIQCEKSVYEEYCKNHKEAKGLWNVSFPFFDEIGELTGKDRASGKNVETFGVAVENMDNEMENETNVITDEENEEDDGISVTQTKSHSRHKRARKQPKSKEPKASQEPQMLAAFENVSSNFNSFMQNMNTHLGTMAAAWSRAEEREQDIANKSNMVVTELLQIEGLTSMEALKAANILTAEPNKMTVCYQAPPHLRRQYIIDLLYPSHGPSVPRSI